MQSNSNATSCLSEMSLNFALDSSATSKLLTHKYHTMTVIQDVPRTLLKKKYCTSEYT